MSQQPNITPTFRKFAEWECVADLYHHDCQVYLPFILSTSKLLTDWPAGVITLGNIRNIYSVLATQTGLNKLDQMEAVLRIDYSRPIAWELYVPSWPKLG